MQRVAVENEEIKKFVTLHIETFARKNKINEIKNVIVDSIIYDNMINKLYFTIYDEIGNTYVKINTSINLCETDVFYIKSQN